MHVRTLEEVVRGGQLAGRRVFIRSDLNVPFDDAGRISEDTRIRASIPAIRMALDAGAAVMVTSHLGRPTEGELKPEESLRPVAQRLGELLGRPVPLRTEWVDGVDVRARRGRAARELPRQQGREEEQRRAGAQDRRVVRRLCQRCVRHRAPGRSDDARCCQVRTDRVCRPAACAEIDALGRALGNPKRPLAAIVAGSKVSTKLTLLNNLAQKVDRLIVGGGIANTFLLAEGFRIGKSLAEPDLVPECKKVLATLAAKGATLPLPIDVVVAHEFSATAPATVRRADDVHADEMILDIGPQSALALSHVLREAGTIIWNGPVGVFEFDAFSEGTHQMALAIAEATANGAFSIAGGGDTLAAIARYGIADRISYISTGGGAFLEFLEGKKLPAIEVLQRRAAA